MIGAEANSSGSSWDPKTKLDHYSDGKSDQVSVASLKFKIMMQICLDNHKAMLNGELERVTGMEWNAVDMQVHQNKMLDIIIRWHLIWSITIIWVKNATFVLNMKTFFYD